MKVVYPYFTNIWLADDDEDDLLLVEKAVKEILPAVHLVQFRHCEELLLALQHTIPDLLFLDINMPGMDGKKCLRIIKDTLEYRKLPVVMLTISQYPMDIFTSYGYGATLYVVKPSVYDKTVEIIKAAFGLPWDDPERITANQYQDNRFVPFRAE